MDQTGRLLVRSKRGSAPPSGHATQSTGLDLMKERGCAEVNDFGGYPRREKPLPSVPQAKAAACLEGT
jgi:hypothetical protein